MAAATAAEVAAATAEMASPATAMSTTATVPTAATVSQSDVRHAHHRGRDQCHPRRKNAFAHDSIPRPGISIQI
jgi:hypothetical protein